MIRRRVHQGWSNSSLAEGLAGETPDTGLVLAAMKPEILLGSVQGCHGALFLI